ncbi:Agamous-like MADS-box protein AGL19 [Morus notabilis]|uniref:Agamous-like MADS-box protein AGL19 n=1 Tax=Morus notabilis TaxID=981085 RepID=W9S967_9ROSA|nr:Agamous-like MADS-box protein AGL19 [Morus notabilis]
MVGVEKKKEVQFPPYPRPRSLTVLVFGAPEFFGGLGQDLDRGAGCFSINKTIDRYNQRRAKDGVHSNTAKAAAPEDHDQQVVINKEDTFSMAKKIEHLELSKRKLLGDGLEACSINELQQIENQLERSLSKIRARKNQLYKEQIERLREEEKTLLKQNAKLREECGLVPLLQWSEQAEIVHNNSIQTVEVETELFIGLPERRK